MKKRRQAADRIDRTQQSARQIENNGQERRRPRRRGWGTAGRVIGTILLVFVLTAAIFAGIFSAYINSSMRGRVEVYLDEFETKVSTELYYQEPSSGEWTMYHTLFLDSENRIWVDLEQIPKDLQKAVIAIEDKRFYKHKGVDWHGTARAIFSTIFGGSVQGGSTITQQLVKNVTGDNQNTVKRKVMEIYRAQEMEKRYEKDEILEAYLNEVYFGYSCYGVVTASLKYFNKDVSELSLAECASLVAITNNPSLYDPLQTDWGLENNRTRQLLVLGAMLEQGKIDQAAYDAAKEENVVFSNGYTILGGRVDVDTDKKDDTDTDGGDEQPEEETKTATSSQSYFTDAVIEDVAAALVEKYGLTDSTNPVTGKVTTAFDQGVNMVYGKGYKIYTTQNPDYQKIAEEVCTDTSNLPYTSTYTNSYGDKETEQLQVGMTIVDPYTGYVVAMVGGAGVKQYDRGWNWATSARQCGSAIKPISVYAPALDDGTINGASSIDDYPVMVLNGSVYPKNANGRYMGLTPLHTAIARSTNTCAVRVVQEYGTSRSYDFMTNKLGFTTLTSQDAQQVGNMGLGGLDRGVTTEEMAAAFAAFANEGIYTAPRTFVRVEDADGNVISGPVGVVTTTNRIPVGLIVKQPDLGTSILVLIAGASVIFFAGLSKRILVSLTGILILSMPVIWSLMHDYQRQRVLTLLDPSADPLGKGFHILQALIAIGSGGFSGKGWMEGTQAHLDFIPERTSDFLFAVFSEEFGFVGNLVLLALYTALIGRSFYIAAFAETRFSRLLAGAIGCIFFTYTFVNMGMVSGILPVVGVPLPFMSYGGTALLILGVCTGILLSVSAESKH